MTTQSIADILQQSIGLNLSSIGANTLQSAIHRRIRALDLANSRDYYHILRATPAEVHELIEEVTVNETWFFRDTEPFAALSKHVTRLRTQNPSAKLSILSLPCSTGEEPYSIAITLLEAGWHESAFHIDAVDINKRVLDRARRASYSKNSFRGQSTSFAVRYFRKCDKEYVLKERYKKAISFHAGNLLGFIPPTPGKKYDIIFCRNLLIYLDANAQADAVQTLASLLAPNGILFIGHAEAGLFAGTVFNASDYPRSFSFVRKQNNSSHLPAPLKGQGAFSHDKPHASKPTRSPQEQTPSGPLFKADGLLEAHYLLQQKKYDDAFRACEKQIVKEGPTALVFYLIAKIHIAQKKYYEATEMLKKTIFLDPVHLEAMELLSHLYEEQSDRSNMLALQERIGRVKKRLGLQRSEPQL